MDTNVKAVHYLANTDLYEYDNTERTVEALVKGGFIVPDPPKSKAVAIAEAAKAYLATCSLRDNPRGIFNAASGWNTDGWNHVLREETGVTTRQEIFRALQLLAEEAGV